MADCFENETVSVIIPVYNAAKHLEKCLDSVVGQTYRNLEIILIDDGSTDDSGEICDKYAGQDARVKVVHQKNAGVAAARNAGLDMARGAYIGWVDSDDWVEPQMFERMLDSARTYSTDIVICGRQEIHPEQCVLKAWQQETALNREQAIALLVEDDQVKSYLWDKLWRRELFDGIRIPELKVFEDMAVMYQVFMRAKRVVCLPDVLYHYRHGGESLSENPSMESRLDFYQVTQSRYKALQSDYPHLAERLEGVLASAAVHIWAVYDKYAKAEQAKYDVRIKEIAAFNRKHYKKALAKNNMGMAGRLILRLTPYPSHWAFALAGAVSRCYEKKHGRPL